MKKLSRKKFLSLSALVTAAAVLPLESSARPKTKKNYLVHHIFYWLKNPDSAEDRNKLIEGLEKLCTIRSVKIYQVGQPETFKKDAPDKSYHLSLLTIFEGKEGLESFHKDPIHDAFVKEYKGLWDKKLGFDSIHHDLVQS